MLHVGLVQANLVISEILLKASSFGSTYSPGASSTVDGDPSVVGPGTRISSGLTPAPPAHANFCQHALCCQAPVHLRRQLDRIYVRCFLVHVPRYRLMSAGKKSHGLSGGAKAGIAIVVIFVVGGGGGYVFYQRRKVCLPLGE
jgi:hypothetical protein